MSKPNRASSSDLTRRRLRRIHHRQLVPSTLPHPLLPLSSPQHLCHRRHPPPFTDVFLLHSSASLIPLAWFHRHGSTTIASFLCHLHTTASSDPASVKRRQAPSRDVVEFVGFLSLQKKRTHKQN
ncbi:hypothetical protein HA466_0167350 [Hirschfeldia incana]|nr:hypothetical protein HA466_0167350 [Hirschfeldia incana]